MELAKGKIYDKKPFRMELIAEKRYGWCTCGWSRKQVSYLVNTCENYITEIYNTGHLNALKNHWWQRDRSTFNLLPKAYTGL